MPALAGVGFNPAGVVVFANGAAIFFGFHLGGQRAIAQIVRALNSLLHGATIPSLVRRDAALGHPETAGKKTSMFFCPFDIAQDSALRASAYF